MIRVAANTLMLGTTGKKFYAYEGTLSIRENGALVYGWDGEVCGLGDGITFTTTERTEIADAMIARWQQWKNPHRRGAQ